MELDKLLNSYINNPSSFQSNFDLGCYYYSLGQTATAVSFFIRAAERTDLVNLQYECMLKAGICFIEQGTRFNSATGMIQHAISLLPKRPEGYFLLSRFYERTKQWFLGYTFASIGWEVTTDDHPPLKTDIDYPGRYGILFEKAVTAWWCGLCDESRDLFREVLFEYPLQAIYRTSCINNLKNLNSWKKPEDFSLGFNSKDSEVAAAHKDLQIFNQEDIRKLKVGFKNSHIISRNYSEAFQDLFVLTALDGKLNGKYVEIGAGYPFYGNNTFLLESEFEWEGVSLDIHKEFVERHTQDRKNPALLLDARYLEYEKLFIELGYGTDLDYLQLDTDPPSVTYEVLTKIPFTKYRFAVITYEHDFYNDISKTFRDKSREYLENLGYVLAVGNVAPTKGRPFEDWWVHPELVNLNRLKKILEVEKEEVVPKEFFFGDKPLEYWRSTPYPTLEITTSIPQKGCVVDCVFCPQRTLVKSYNGEKKLSLENFKRVLDKIPNEVRITFAGFTEPWLHRECTDMLLYAYEKGHPVCAFTTGVGMKKEDIERIKDVKFAGNPNGGFVLHLPDNEHFAKHPITPTYIELLEYISEIKEEIHNFSMMCMGTVHDTVGHIFPQLNPSIMWSRAGNLLGEAILKPELMNLKDSFNTIYHGDDPMTCNCDERLYHNVMLPNGDVSLCCMDYGLENILGNLFSQSYEEILPEPYHTFRICTFCENGISPDQLKVSDTK